MIVLTQAGKVRLLQAKIAVLNACTLRLFKSDSHPTDATVAADLVEADFDGYLPQALNDFGNAFLNLSNQAQTSAPLHTFGATGALTPNQIYGYFVTAPDGVMIFADRNAAAPVTVSGDGSSYSVAPQFLEDTMP